MDCKPTGDVARGETMPQVVPGMIARRGWHVMIPGDVYNACYELVERLLAQDATDPEGRKFLDALRKGLVEQARPYAPKYRVQPAKQMP